MEGTDPAEKTCRKPNVYTFISPVVLTLWTDVLLDSLIVFLLIFLKAHLLFEYPDIWLPSLLLDLCLCGKQAWSYM